MLLFERAGKFFSSNISFLSDMHIYNKFDLKAHRSQLLELIACFQSKFMLYTLPLLDQHRCGQGKRYNDNLIFLPLLASSSFVIQFLSLQTLEKCI
jgi:hypothetical protein